MNAKRYREYIGFEDEEFESLPQSVQDRFLNEEYIKELKTEDQKFIIMNRIRIVPLLVASMIVLLTVDCFGNYSKYELSVNNSIYYNTNAYTDWYKRTY